MVNAALANRAHISYIGRNRADLNEKGAGGTPFDRPHDKEEHRLTGPMFIFYIGMKSGHLK